MKKMIIKRIALMSLIVANVVSCNKKNLNQDTVKINNQQIKVDVVDSSKPEEKFISSQDFFIPDYTPCEPEEQTQARFVKLQKVSSSEKVASIIPGLRKLNAYKTDLV